ncbi:hypothetical protein ACOSP7_013886 [Xanthoceras sorbifolium]
MRALALAIKRKRSSHQEGLGHDWAALGFGQGWFFTHSSTPKHNSTSQNANTSLVCDYIEDLSKRRRRTKEEKSKRETSGFQFSTSSNGLYCFPFSILLFNQLYE